MNCLFSAFASFLLRIFNALYFGGQRETGDKVISVNLSVYQSFLVIVIDLNIVYSLNCVD